MNTFKPMQSVSGILSFILAAGFTVARAQDAPDVGPHAPGPPVVMESHIGNLTGHSQDAKYDYRRYCVGCHGELGDGQGENTPWLDPKPRNFTLATFKCRSTPTGTLPSIPICLTPSVAASPTPTCPSGTRLRPADARTWWP